MFIPIGSIVNFFSVLIGSLIGLNFGKLINKRIQKLIFKLIFMGQSIVRFLPKKNNTDTETVGLVYNKFKIAHNHANKTRR